MSEEKNIIGGTVGAQADVAGSVGGTTPVKPKPGALVEDETLSGLQDGGVAPKAPDGRSTEEGATDARENPSA